MIQACEHSSAPLSHPPNPAESHFLRGTVEEDFAELLEEDGVDPLPSHGFIFFDHQGYQFFWFTLGAGPDPEVFHHSTTTKSHRAVAPSFSRWLEQRIESEYGVT